MMFLLYAASFVLRHHHFVLLDGIDRALVCILARGFAIVPPARVVRVARVFATVLPTPARFRY